MRTWTSCTPSSATPLSSSVRLRIQPLGTVSLGTACLVPQSVPGARCPRDVKNRSVALDPRECKRLTFSSVVVVRSGDAPKVAVAEVQGGFPVWDLQTSGLERSGSSSGASG